MNKGVVAEMAECLSDPITFVDNSGKTRSFRKYLWMGNWGITDVKGNNPIVPAKTSYLQVEILQPNEIIIAGNCNTGWDIFSLDGKYISSYPNMPFDSLVDLFFPT